MHTLTLLFFFFCLYDHNIYISITHNVIDAHLRQIFFISNCFVYVLMFTHVPTAWGKAEM